MKVGRADATDTTFSKNSHNFFLVDHLHHLSTTVYLVLNRPSLTENLETFKMGCCLSLCSNSNDDEYSPINNKENDSSIPGTGQYNNDSERIEMNNSSYQDRGNFIAVENTVFHAVPDHKDDVLRTFDLNSSVFNPSLLEQKFSNKSSYEIKYAWINTNARTLNLSEHSSKERRHKEAGLTDVVSVIAGPPDKYKPRGGDPANVNPNHCLTIKFVRGGGIDFKFKGKEERDIWYDVISGLVMQQKKIDIDSNHR